MKLLNKSLVFVLLGMLVFAACKKDDAISPNPNNPGGNNNPPDTTNTQYLTMKPWKVRKTRMLENGTTDTVNVTITGQENFRLTFMADGTGVAIGTILGGGSFTWAFGSNETQVILTKSGAPTTYKYTKTSLQGATPNVPIAIIDENGNTRQIIATMFEEFERLP